jgi:hypothetical protein
MRDYAKVGPQFWIGKTGKALRRAGADAQIVGMYLLTSPHANMLGLYYLAKESIAHETGLGAARASVALLACAGAGFCSYDDETEMVWVHEMAFYQIAEVLLVNDKRIKGVQNEYNGLPDNPFLAGFFTKYSEPFGMTTLRGGFRSEIIPIEAPTKPLPSQEQEQEQEQNQEQEKEKEQAQEQVASASAVAAAKKSEPKEEPNPLNLATWQAYKQAYTERYSVAPIRDAATNAKIKSIVKGLGEEAPPVAAFFVSHNGARYVAGMHQIGFMATDYAKLRTEWATNTRMTQTKAQQADKTATNLDAFAPLIAEARAREEAERGAQ